MGPAAVSNPAIPPPITRPSGPANDTLMPPVLFLMPLLSLAVNEPDKDNISNRPCQKLNSSTKLTSVETNIIAVRDGNGSGTAGH